MNLLLSQLKSAGALKRAKAIRDLATLDAPSAWPHISRALSDRSAKVRFMAALYLGEMKRKEAVDPLTRALSDPDEEVRGTAVKSLGVILSESKKTHPKIIKKLIEMLSDSANLVRFNLVEALGIFLAGQGKAPPQLVKRLKDRYSLVRMEAAESISMIEDKSALSSLWQAMKDRSPLVRSYVAGAIGFLGKELDRKKLEDYLDNEISERAKIGYYEGLYLLGQRSVLEDILDSLRKKDYRVRSSASNVLCDVVADSNNAQIILPALEKAYKKETNASAQDTFKNCMLDIEKRFFNKVEK